MSARCSQCSTRLAPASRRCRKCGALVERRGPDEIVTFARPDAPYASGDPIAGNYTVVEHHGSGPLGATYRARDADGRFVAVKIVTESLLPTPGERAAFVGEFGSVVGKVMPHVALPLEVGIDVTDRVFVVSPWIHGASLRRILRGWRTAERALSPDLIFGLLQGTAAALRELHTASSHGALYPENVHVTSEGVVLADAVIAGVVQPARLAEHIARSPEVAPYMAPEVRAGKRSNAGADYHGLGALASELTTGDPTRARQPGFVLPELGAEVAEAITLLLSERPSQRVGALPLLLERLARVAGLPSLPHPSLLPPPMSEGPPGLSERPSGRPPQASPVIFSQGPVPVIVQPFASRPPPPSVPSRPPPPPVPSRPPPPPPGSLRPPSIPPQALGPTQTDPAVVPPVRVRVPNA